MEVTEVRIKLMSDPHERLLAFCSITLDACFVIRDLKIIQGTRGAFVAMPSRKLTDHCGRCHAKNHLRARFCSDCGATLDENRAVPEESGRAKLYADIAHPINSACRESIQSVVLSSYEEELVRAEQPNYICRYDDYGEDRVAIVAEDEMAAPAPTAAPAPAAPAASAGSNGSSKRRFQTPDERTHRIDPGEPRNGKPHEQRPQRQKATTAATREDGFSDGLV